MWYIGILAVIYVILYFMFTKVRDFTSFFLIKEHISRFYNTYYNNLAISGNQSHINRVYL